MPLIKFDLIIGRSPEKLQTLLDATHDAMVRAFNVPERDRYQIVHQHPANEMMIEDTGLGFTRTQDVVVLTVTSRPRSVEQKQAFYKETVEALRDKCGIDPQDVLISIVTNSDEDWSFGLGEAQFITGKL